MQRALPQEFSERINFAAGVIWILRVLVAVIVIWGATSTLAAGFYSPSQWRDLVIFGLAQGGVYALIALGYTMVYGILGFINFAHGEVFMSGMMIGYFVADYLNEVGMWNGNPVLAFLIVLVVSMFTSTSVAVLVERIAYRPLRESPRIVPLITSIGASFFIQYAFRGLFGAGVKSYPRMEALEGAVTVLGVRILKVHVLVIVAVFIMMALLYWFVERTRTGKAIRAVAEDKEIAALMGVDIDRAIVTTFAIGGMMAGAAGLLYALVFSQVFFFSGFLPGIKAFTAAVLGGIGNIVGAMLGGIVLGIVESVGPILILSGLGIPAPHQLKDVVAFTVLVLVLIFRPKGLLGERLAEERD
ncbi:MAG: branched-chain amino acid ABC transporter permease [Ardenticatenia bacterium]|nr:branched-chain amino acid ABC transporter permease [Ardenticatenia bacterium]